MELILVLAIILFQILFINFIRQTIGTVSYNGKTYGSEQDENAGKLTIKVKPGTVGYDDRNGWEDTKGFHKFETKK